VSASLRRALTPHFSVTFPPETVEPDIFIEIRFSNYQYNCIKNAIGMNETNSNISIHESELKIEFVQASGPGGQNINKVATAVQLRFDILNSKSLPEEVKERLIKSAGKRVTQEGILLIEAKRFRTQEKNRADALARFYLLVQKAFEKPKPRKKTKPSAVSVEKRLEKKKQHGEIKRGRQKYQPEE
jgi:ribosome-associated protein